MEACATYGPLKRPDPKVERQGATRCGTRLALTS
jgi:hypothetical protein